MKLGAITISTALAVSGLFGQTAPALEGTFVLAEEGVLANGAPFASLAKLTIGTSGAVTGSQVWQGVTYDLQGAYTLESDGSGTLSLTASSTNSDGETVIVPESYKLVRPAAGGAVVLRTNPGIFATGTLSVAATSPLTGTYYLTEEPAGRQSARLAVLTLDSAGSISGFEIVNSVFAAGKRDIKGSYQANSSGFTTLSFSVTTTDENGDAVATTENYAVLGTRNELKALRIDAGSARVATFEK